MEATTSQWVAWPKAGRGIDGSMGIWEGMSPMSHQPFSVLQPLKAKDASQCSSEDLFWRSCSHESVVMLGGCCGPRILPLYGHVFFEPILMNPVDLAVGHGCPSELRRATGPILSGTCGAWCWMKNNHGPRCPSRKLFGQLVY